MKYVKLFIISLFILTLFFSCGSLPEKEYNEAKMLREKIDKYELQQYDEASFKQAETSYQTGTNYYSDGKKGKSKKALTASIPQYQSVVTKGMPKYVDKKKQETDVEMQEADDLKANVAVSNEYKAAKTKYNSGLTEAKNKNLEKAAELLTESKTDFEKVNKITRQKKGRAEDAKSESDKKIGTIDETDRELKEMINDETDTEASDNTNEESGDVETEINDAGSSDGE